VARNQRFFQASNISRNQENKKENIKKSKQYGKEE